MADRNELERLLVEHLPIVERILTAVGCRQGLREDDLADFSSWAMVRLVADDYAVLQRFRGESSLATYLTVVLTMAAREYRVARWGRWRPSAAARAAGPLAVRLETLVYRDGLRLAEAADLLRTRGETALSDRALAALVAALPMRVSVRGSTSAATNDVSVDTLADDGSADDPLLRGETDNDRARLGRRLAEAIGRLSVEDQALVRLRYWEGLSVADTARALNVPQKPLYRRLERVVGVLRDDLVANGVAVERVRALLDESMPVSAAGGEESSARPSIPGTGHEERIA